MERFGLKRKIISRKSNKEIFFLKGIIIIVCIIMLFQKMTDLVEGTLHSLCEAKVESIGITISNKAIDDVMDGIKYEDLIMFDKDENGKIIALKSNVVEMNNIASEIATKVQNMYDELEDIYVYVPLGNFAGNSFLAGHGPDIKVKVIPAGTVNTDFKTEFISAGINQTRHRVYLGVVCNMRVIAPFATEDIVVDNSVTVAETVLIGEVPEFYTNSQ